jgi:hypothetical protein
MDEVPGAKPPLLPLDEQEALAEEDEEVLLRIFGVVQPVGLVRLQDLEADAELRKLSARAFEEALRAGPP